MAMLSGFRESSSFSASGGESYVSAQFNTWLMSFYRSTHLDRATCPSSAKKKLGDHYDAVESLPSGKNISVPGHLAMGYATSEPRLYTN